ncbi:MAG TPA: type II toxin-antitoxin system HipA family toxin [Candidatus Baltobacteraceae bacterium]
MNLPAGTPLQVIFEFAQGKRLQVGRLALARGAVVFQYAPEIARSQLMLNPFIDPPTTRGLISPKNPRDFQGLHGAFAHSLPDAWGEMLVRRRAEAEGISHASLTALDKLAIVGRRGPGALIYEPELTKDPTETVDLDALAASAAELLDGRETVAIEQLERLGGSSGGARPKVLVGINDAGRIRPGDADLPAGYTHWIVKFRSSANDIADIGALEAAYADMARAAGLQMSETRLIEGSKGRYFATKRFDRLSGNRRIHMLSAATLLDVGWDEASMGYEQLMKLTRQVTRNERAVDDMYRRMVFNVLAHNRDDHANQHAYLMDERGEWILAPAFDLTYSDGVGTEHYMDVVGRGGDDITLSSFEKLANTQGIRTAQATAIFDEVSAAVRDFATYARKYELSASTLRATTRDLHKGLARFA